MEWWKQQICAAHISTVYRQDKESDGDKNKTYRSTRCVRGIRISQQKPDLITY